MSDGSRLAIEAFAGYSASTATIKSGDHMVVPRPALLLELTAATRETRFLRGHIAPGWIVRRPLEIKIERDEIGESMASDDQLAIYGLGADRDAAIADYIESLIEYYELIEAESVDHPPTAALLRHIQHYVARVSE